MVSSINSLNSSNIGFHELEVMRRLQSLGVRPTGNLLRDRQLLQQAEFYKLQSTLSMNNNTNQKDFGYRFEDTLNALNNSNNEQNKVLAKNMTGATQIASLNRFNLGL